MTEHQIPSKSWHVPAKLLISPLWASVIILVVVLAIARWSWGKAQAAQLSAARAGQNVERIYRAAAQLQTLLPRAFAGEGGPAVSGLLDTAVKSAQIADHSVRAESIRARGALGDTGMLRQSAHVELAGLTQIQSANVVDVIERSPLPVWIESADLSDAGSDHWTLVLELAWLENPRAVKSLP